jgi:hypothetical protein
VEVAENFPEQGRYMLETLGGIWHHDALARKQGLSPEERLRFHQEHSGPLMKTLHDWMESNWQNGRRSRTLAWEGRPVHAPALDASDSFSA